MGVIRMKVYWKISILSFILAVTYAQQEWWQTATFYQVYPRSHKDTSGDGIGDIQGIIEKIPHFLDAGITCVWLSPIYESPMADFGYDISNFTAIDPIFGTWDDFVEMSNALKAAGLRLVMDIVPNHSSDQHEWFIKSIAREDPYTDYYVWKPSLGVDGNGSQIPPNNWISAFAGSAWEWNEDRQQFYLHQFTVQQPDLDYRNPLVVEEMKNVLRFWLENGVDGFRLDAPGHYVEHIDFMDEPPTNDPNCPPDQFCQLEHIYVMNQPESIELLYEFRQVINEYEIQTGEPKVVMSEPTNNHTITMSFYGNATHPIMDFPFNVDLILTVNNQSNAFDYVNIINRWLDTMPEGATANWVIGNHDQFRVATRQGSEFALTTIMMTLLLPGVTVTYYGEEINMENTFVSWEETQDPQGCNAGPEYYQRYSRDPQRTPFQWNNQTFAGFTAGNSTWLPVNDNYLVLNLEAQIAAPRSPFKVYKAVTLLRNTLPSVQRGTFDIRVVNPDVLAFTREMTGETSVLMAANTAYTPTMVDLRTVFFALPTQGIVHTASLTSALQNGETVDFSAVPLEARGGIVILY